MARPKRLNSNSVPNDNVPVETTMSYTTPEIKPDYCTFFRNDKAFAEDSRLMRRELDRTGVDVIQVPTTSEDEQPRILYDGGEIIGFNAEAIQAVFG